MGKKIKALCFTDGLDNTKETILATTEETLQSGEREKEIAEKFKEQFIFLFADKANDLNNFAQSIATGNQGECKGYEFFWETIDFID